MTKVKTIIVNKDPPQVKVVYQARKTPKVITSAKILRGQPGATDFQAIAPLDLDSNGDLKLIPFEFIQAATLATWNINHGLGKKFPSVVIVDENEKYVEGEICPIDENNLSIIFAIPIMGKAYIS